MPVDTVTLDELIEPEWGNQVAAAVAALESADAAIQAALGVITANSWVTTARIANAAVTEGKLASNSVTAAKIAAGQVTEAKIASGAVTTAKIANGDVTNAKLASGIDAGKLTTGTLPAARIGSNAITTARIANNQVTNDKLANVPTSNFQPTGGGLVRFWRLSNVVFCGIYNLQDAYDTAAGQLESQFRPGFTVSFAIHRSSDAAHRTAIVRSNGSFDIDGSGGSWNGFAAWIGS